MSASASLVVNVGSAIAGVLADWQDPATLGLAVAAIAVVAAVAVALLRRRSSGAVDKRSAPGPLDPVWAATLDRELPLYRGMTLREREHLHARMRVFLAEKHFEGCGGFTITDEVRVVIAAQACILLLGHPDLPLYPRLRSVLVYPTTVLPRRAYAPEHGVLHHEEEPLEGESWSLGSLVLSWASVRAGARHADDGRNVVFHEFAHQLDFEDGASDGAPSLAAAEIEGWRAVMRAHFEELRVTEDAGQESFLDPYGATDEAEFFAVCTEHYFEEPLELQAQHPELFDALLRFYVVDPRRWERVVRP